jgi:hypothetical protein
MQVMACGELSRSILGIRDVYSSLQVRQQITILELTIANVIETSVQNDRSIYKHCCRYFFHAGDLGSGRHCLGIREMLLRRPVLLTFATADEFCNNIPPSRVNIVCQVDDIIADNTDIS